jgi:hypothetical protein
LSRKNALKSCGIAGQGMLNFSVSLRFVYESKIPQQKSGLFAGRILNEGRQKAEEVQIQKLCPARQPFENFRGQPSFSV